MFEFTWIRYCNNKMFKNLVFFLGHLLFSQIVLGMFFKLNFITYHSASCFGSLLSCFCSIAYSAIKRHKWRKFGKIPVSTKENNKSTSLESEMEKWYTTRKLAKRMWIKRSSWRNNLSKIPSTIQKRCKKIVCEQITAHFVLNFPLFVLTVPAENGHSLLV